MAGLLLLGNDFCNSNEDFDSEQADTVLVVIGKMLEKRNHLLDDDICGHGSNKFGHVGCSLSPYHGRVIMNQLCILLAELDFRLLI